MKARGIAANSALALTGDVAAKVGALLAIIVAARTFSVEEFAAVATALAAAAVLVATLDLGAGTLLARDGTSGKESRGSLLRGLLVGRVPLVLALLLGAALLGAWLGALLTALAIVALSISGALALSILGVYRSTRDLGPEARQRIVSANLAVVSAILCGIAAPRADVLLLALTLVTLVTVLPLARRLPAIADLSRSVSPAAAMHRVLPFGLIVLGTVAYYRAGTIVLAALGDDQETAAFGVAATLAFGLLMVPNAITTALLPRLAAERDSAEVVACARRALVWTLAISVPMAACAAALAPWVLPFLLGSDYALAAPAFALLCVGVPIIATSGVIGTTVIAVGRLGVLGLQVACTLLLNLAALAVLAPPLGAVGAALATVICELGGLVLLVVASRRLLPGLLSVRRASVDRRVAPQPVAGGGRVLGV
jgi:O-antigen/teichoic acid export membrane protein